MQSSLFDDKLKPIKIDIIESTDNYGEFHCNLMIKLMN